MQTNATLTRLDTPGAPDAAGTIAYTQGAAISIDAFIDAPTNSQKWGLGETISNATAVIYVDRTDAQSAGLSIGPKMRLLVAIDGEAAVLYEVVYVRVRVSASLDHYEAFLQVLS